MITLDHDIATSARLASTCTRCGVGGWHPEARSCQLPNCGLAAADIDPLGAVYAPGAGAGLTPSLGPAPAVSADVDPLLHAQEIAR